MPTAIRRTHTAHLIVASLVLTVLTLMLGPVGSQPAHAQALPLGDQRAIGFGQHAVGGSTPFVVTSLASSGPGTLADAVSLPGRHITFGVSGTIHLPHKLFVSGDTTIDGAGADVTITGRPLVLQTVDNVVIRHLSRTDGIGVNDDGIQVLDGTTDVWLDHLTLARIPDEAIEVSQGATDVTVSWVHIHDQDRGILIGNRPDHGDGADPSNVTVHNSWLDGVVQRQPRAVRWAHLHAFNNVIEGWTATAMSAAQQAHLLSESNVLVRGTEGAGLITKAGQGKKNPLPGLARSSGDLTLGGSVAMAVNQPSDVFTPPYDYAVEAATTQLADVVRLGAGAHGLAAPSTPGDAIEPDPISTPTPTPPPAPAPTYPGTRAYFGRAT